jgi:hypothetical protein
MIEIGAPIMEFYGPTLRYGVEGKWVAQASTGAGCDMIEIGAPIMEFYGPTLRYGVEGKWVAQASTGAGCDMIEIGAPIIELPHIALWRRRQVGRMGG